MALGEQSAVQPPPASDQPIGAQPPVIKDVPVVAQAIETKTEAPRDLQRKPVFHAGDALLITTYPTQAFFFAASTGSTIRVSPICPLSGKSK